MSRCLYIRSGFGEDETESTRRRNGRIIVVDQSTSVFESLFDVLIYVRKKTLFFHYEMKRRLF